MFLQKTIFKFAKLDNLHISLLAPNAKLFFVHCNFPREVLNGDDARNGGGGGSVYGEDVRGRVWWVLTVWWVFTVLWGLFY